MKILVRMLLFCVLTLLVGCAGQDFRLQNFVKTDIDMVADAHQREVEALLQQLMVKLYKRNPKNLRLGRKYTIEDRTYQIFESSGHLHPPELPVTGTAAIELALNREYSGDRVFALMVGLVEMVRQSYNYQSEFYIFSELDGQKLYLSARNLEITLWRLNRYLDDQGRPLILTNSLTGEPQNLSYERLFGKMIALQDMMGGIVAAQNQRMIKTVAQNVATMAFFPM